MNWTTIKSILSKLQRSQSDSENIKSFISGGFERKFTHLGKPCVEILSIRILSTESRLYEISLNRTIDEGSQKISTFKIYKAVYDSSKRMLLCIKGRRAWAFLPENFKVLQGKKEYRRRFGL